MEIKDRQKIFVDEMFLNGFNRKQAYALAYPDCQEHNIAASVCQVMRKPLVKEYYASKYKEFQEILSIDKFQIIDGLRKQIDLYNDMVELSSRDSLTQKEEDKLGRLNDLVKGSDIMKCRDMICRIIGAYEPEVIKVENKTYKVGFDLDSEEVEIIP